MANKFYDPGEQRAAKVNDLFAAIAPHYDLINDLQSFGLHRWWKRRLLKIAAPRPGEHTLDLCCGTGDVAFALAQAGAETTGFDFSEPMLAVAHARAKKIPHSALRISSRATRSTFPSPTTLMISSPSATACGTSRILIAVCARCTA